MKSYVRLNAVSQLRTGLRLQAILLLFFLVLSDAQNRALSKPGHPPGSINLPSPTYPELIRKAGVQALKLVEQGQFQEAIPLWQQLVRWQQEHLGPGDERTLRSLRNLAAVQLAAGQSSDAADSYSALRERMLQFYGPDSLDTAQASLDLARVWRTETRFDQAEQLTRQTLARLQALPAGASPALQLRLAEAQELLGTIAHEQGRYGVAETAHRQALAQRLALEGERGTGVATARANLAQALLRQGRTAEALQLQRMALSGYQASNGDSRRQQSTVLTNIALAQNLLGQSAASETTLQQALALKTQLMGVDHPETARLLLNLAALEAEQGDTAAALAHIRQALSTLQNRLGTKHLSTAFALQRMAELARSVGQPAHAREWGRSALKIRLEQLEPWHPDLATTRLGLGLSELALGNQSGGEAELTQAVAIRRRVFGPDHPSTGMAELLLGLSLWEGPKQQQASESLAQAVRAYEHVLRSQAPLLPLRERGRLVATIQESRNALYSLVGQGPRGRDLALRARLNLHGRLEEIERRQSRLERSHPEGAATAQALEVLTQQLEQETPGSSAWRRMELQRQGLEQRLSRIRRAGEAEGLALVQPEQVARALPSSAVLVEFLQYQPVRFSAGGLRSTGEPRLAALVLDGDAAAHYLDLGPAARINQAIWSALVETQRAGLDSDQAWVRVGDLVIRPLLPLIGRQRTWYFSPDGELHRVPFAALASQQQGNLRRYGEDHTIRLITSGRELLMANRLHAGPAAPLLLADPDFEAAPPPEAQAAGVETGTEQGLPEAWRRLRWSRLPGSRAEGEILHRLLGGRLMTDIGANSETLIAVRSPRLLHVASHGAFLPGPKAQAHNDRDRQLALEGQGRPWDDPMLRSVVVLTGANRTDPKQQDAGYLTAREASRLQLDGTRLVTLSACESGKGAIELGEGVYGLRRALAVAGAESTLLSLWKVDDRATRALMESFYAEMEKGFSPEKSLQAAQQRMRTHERRDWRTPYVWAAFQLYGWSW